MPNSETNPTPQPQPSQIDDWQTPTMTTLPVEATATNTAFGDDGNGPTTHS